MSIFDDLRSKEQELIQLAGELSDISCDRVSELDDRLIRLIDTVRDVINMSNEENILIELDYILEELKNIKEDLY